MFRATLVGLLLALLPAWSSVTTVNQSATGTNRAEQLRSFLATKGALVRNSTLQLAPALEAYLTQGLSPLRTYGIRQVLDNPPSVRPDALNVFGVTFKHPADSFCTASDVRSDCFLLADNCLTITSSVFCDVAYLNRLLDIPLAALSYSWSGVREAQRVGRSTVLLSPFRTEGLIDLARIQTASRTGRTAASVEGLLELPVIRATDVVGESNLLEVLKHVVFNLVLSHELAHVEQNLGVRTAAAAAQHQIWSSLVQQTTCATTSALESAEVKADLRAMELAKHFLESDLAELKRRGGGFSPQLGAEMKRDFERLLPIAREIATLATVYLLEYELFVHLDPEGGLALLQGMRPLDTTRGLYTYLVTAGNNSPISTAYGHLDPALRALFIVDVLDAGRLGRLDRTTADSFVEIRLVPFIIGRLQRLQQKRCGRTEATFMPFMMNQVLAAFGNDRRLTATGRSPLVFPEWTTRGKSNDWSMRVAKGWIGGNPAEIEQFLRSPGEVWSSEDTRGLLRHLQKSGTTNDVVLLYAPATPGRDDSLIQVWYATGYYPIEEFRKLDNARRETYVRQRYPANSAIVTKVTDNLTTGGYPAFRTTHTVEQPNQETVVEVLQSIFLADRRMIQNFRLVTDPDTVHLVMRDFTLMLDSVVYQRRESDLVARELTPIHPSSASRPPCHSSSCRW